jgi:hypothetical protein
LIDLHLHTTASDGRLEPSDLVHRVWDAGVRVLSVTDHDTVAALPEVATLAEARGMEFVPGIEITAVSEERDVHVLGYFFEPRNAALESFLRSQRADRLRRVEEMAARLAALGKPIDVSDLMTPSTDRPGRSVGRPLVAAALVRAGHVATIKEAFDDWIGTGKPAFIGRRGGSPAEVVDLIGEAGGIASLAHPGPLGQDALIPELARRGMAALEAYHSDHDPQTTAHYLAMAARLGLAVSGGSDFHSDAGHRRVGLGRVGLPEERYRELKIRAGR